MNLSNAKIGFFISIFMLFHLCAPSLFLFAKEKGSMPGEHFASTKSNYESLWVERKIAQIYKDNEHIKRCYDQECNDQGCAVLRRFISEGNKELKAHIWHEKKFNKKTLTQQEIIHRAREILRTIPNDKRQLVLIAKGALKSKECEISREEIQESLLIIHKALNGPLNKEEEKQKALELEDIYYNLLEGNKASEEFMIFRIEEKN